ncbi:MAG: hypothetical protein WC734_02400 [Patescibacteria group bacterium]
MPEVTGSDRCEHCGRPIGMGEHTHRIASFDPATGGFQALASQKFQSPSREGGGNPGQRSMYVCCEGHGREVCPTEHFIVWLDEFDQAPVVVWDSSGHQLEPFWGLKTSPSR